MEKVGEWLGSDDVEIGDDCFTWRGGSTRVTTGIHVWPEIFLHDHKDGRKIAIILLDTQGTFDNRTNMKDCVTIFSLSTLLSSVQVYNVMNQIQEDDLQHLQLFSEYGRLVANNDEKPFQKLVFLVRDWNCPWEFEYGPNGGEEFLKKELSTYDGQEQELRSLRNYVRDCFDQIRCFLMPFPGTKVTSNQHFRGKLKDIEKDFKDNLLILIPLLLAPENLIAKRINGRAVKASEFVDYFENYFNVFNGDQLPKPLTIFEATSKVHNEGVLNDGKSCYTTQMREFTSSVMTNKQEALEAEHLKASENAMSILREKQLMGGNDALTRLQLVLSDFIREEYGEFIKINNGKLSWVKISCGVAVVLASSAAATAAAVFSPAASAAFLAFLVSFARKSIGR